MRRLSRVAACAGLLLAAGSVKAAGPSLAVAFDAALTNATDWTYPDGFTYAKSQGAFGFTKNGEHVCSPTLDFNVTSVTVRANLSSEKTVRTLWVVPTAGAAGATEHERPLVLAADGSPTNATALWPAEDRVTGLAIFMRGSSGRVYLRDAEIAGVPPVAAPTATGNEAAYRDRFTAAWRNPPDAVTNELALFRITRKVPTVEWLWQTDFALFTNGLTTTEVTDRLHETYPGFGGRRLYAPQNTNGIVRIGSRDDAGILTCVGFTDCAGRFLVLRAWRHEARDEGWMAPVSWIRGNATNALGTVTLGTVPAYVGVSLDGVPDGATVAVHSSTNRSTASRANGRVYVDRFGVATAYSEGSAETSLVARTRFPAVTRRKVRGLERGVAYEWSVRTIGADGGVSPWTASESVPADRDPPPDLFLRLK